MAWGNTLFEWSLIRAGIGGDWLEPLREAVARFRDGGAKEEDIKNAMELHLFRDEFSLPPNPKVRPEASLAAARCAAWGLLMLAHMLWRTSVVSIHSVCSPAVAQPYKSVHACRASTSLHAVCVCARNSWIWIVAVAMWVLSG